MKNDRRRINSECEADTCDERATQMPASSMSPSSTLSPSPSPPATPFSFTSKPNQESSAFRKKSLDECLRILSSQPFNSPGILTPISPTNRPPIYSYNDRGVLEPEATLRSSRRDSKDNGCFVQYFNVDVKVESANSAKNTTVELRKRPILPILNRDGTIQRSQRCEEKRQKLMMRRKGIRQRDFEFKALSVAAQIAREKSGYTEKTLACSNGCCSDKCCPEGQNMALGPCPRCLAAEVKKASCCCSCGGKRNAIKSVEEQIVKLQARIRELGHEA